MSGDLQIVLPSKDLVIVANRLPVHRVRRTDGMKWEISPGGLVSALSPLLQQSSGQWVGWTGRSGAAPKPFLHDGIQNIPVSMSKSEVTDFYHGFSNTTLWPLYHDAIRQPIYRRRWWNPYREVNQRFAELAAEVAPKKATVWIQDYQLQLVPKMLRTIRPDVRIGFFLHIPFPPTELFAQLPWRRAILEGLLGADVVGFQTRTGAQNFQAVARRYTQARGTGQVLRVENRQVLASAFPISIDYQRFNDMAKTESVMRRMQDIRKRVGHDRKIILGVDRLDYTKGIDIRIRAFEELLASGRWSPQECVLVQVAVPSREVVDEYVEVRRRIDELVGKVNGQYGQLGMAAIDYLRRNLDAEELIAMYRCADVMLVTPLRDGMNLIAKEFVASRVENRGVLVLSEFTGAAKELRGAIQVNPHDIDGLMVSIEEALSMSPSLVTRRMRSMRETIRRHTVHDWARSFLGAVNQ